MTAMRTLYIATAFALLAGSTAHAGSIIDSFMNGSGFNLGECNTDHCGFSVGKKKYVVRKSDVTSVLNGVDSEDKAPSAKPSAKGRDRSKPADTAPAERSWDRTRPSTQG